MGYAWLLSELMVVIGWCTSVAVGCVDLRQVGVTMPATQRHCSGSPLWCTEVHSTALQTSQPVLQGQAGPHNLDS